MDKNSIISIFFFVFWIVFVGTILKIAIKQNKQKNEENSIEENSVPVEELNCVPVKIDGNALLAQKILSAVQSQLNENTPQNSEDLDSKWANIFISEEENKTPQKTPQHNPAKKTLPNKIFSDKAAIRQAIIAQEILSPPISEREFKF